MCDQAHFFLSFRTQAFGPAAGPYAATLDRIFQKPSSKAPNGKVSPPIPPRIPIPNVVMWEGSCSNS